MQQKKQSQTFAAEEKNSQSQSKKLDIINIQQQTKCPYLSTDPCVNIGKMNIKQFCSFLKEYRMTVRPPIKDYQAKLKFCQLFDNQIIKRTLKDLTQFIRLQKKRKSSQKKQNNLVNDNQCKLKKKISNQQTLGNYHFQSQLEKKTLYQIIDKIILYVWQLANLRTILIYQILHSNSQTQNNKELKSFSIPNQIVLCLHRLCITTSRIYISKWGLRHVTMQAMQIAYFNLLKNKIIEIDPDRNAICCLIQAILNDTQGQQYQKYINIFKFDQQHLQQQSIAGDISYGSPQKQNRQAYKFESPSKRKLSISKQNEQKIKSTGVQLELEWFVFILQYCINNCDTFIKSTYIQLSNGNVNLVTHSGIIFLQFISLLLNKVINDRTTTQIVKGYQCHIQEVKNMYSNNKNNGKEGEKNKGYIQLMISWSDYQWLLDVLLKQTFTKYKNEISKIYISTTNSQPIRDKQQKSHMYDNSYIQCLMNIVSIINCCCFLGGYSPELQKKTTKLTIWFALQFLQLSYLMYELSHAKKKNIDVKIQENIKDKYIQNLKTILHIQNKNSNKDKLMKNQVNLNKQDNLDGNQSKFEINLMQISRNSDKKQQIIVSQQKSKQQQCPSLDLQSFHNIFPLQQGQLVCIIRLLSNLVHINEQAQQILQQNLKYFRIIMSLTHQYEKQLTMKNWAIVFLKNVSERSSVMRAQLEKLKIDIKVDQGNEPFI